MSDDFLSRWSRRKRDAGGISEEAEPAPSLAEEAPPVEVPEEDEAKLLARLGLKHPDEMGPGDDFAAFLKAAVPQHLKTLALRRLWRSNPTLACLDGLNDYDGDFTGTGVPAGGLKTSYQVGRGLLRQIAEVAEDRSDAPTDGAGASASNEAQEPETVAAEPEDRPGEPQGGPEKAQLPEFVQENDAPRATRRRMVFRTDG